MVTKPDHAVYEFGPFRLEESEFLLLRDGLPVPLKAKAFQLLLMLVRNAGHVLMKDQLMEQIWQNVCVEEHNLAVHISEIRKALGSEYKYVETISRHGYRFVAKVTKFERQAFGASSPDIRSSRSRPDYQNISNSISIAILPLKSITGETADEYLGVGLADVLITRLSVLRKVIVRPTRAVRRYTEDAEPIAVGRELQVGFVLDGSIQRDGVRIRVTVQLISVENGAILWAGKYDESCTDILALEDSISEQVAVALALELMLEESNHLMKRQTDSVEAYMAYMKGRFFWSKYTPADINRSLEYFAEAIRIDPNFALAYVGLGRAKVSLFSYGVLSPKDDLPEIERLLNRALELDASFSEAHAIKAPLRLFIDWDWAGSEREHQLSISTGHNCALAYENYGIYLSFVGRFDEALALSQRAQALEPTSLLISTSVCRILFFARQYERSIYQLKNILELDANASIPYFLLGTNYDEIGEYEKAQAAYIHYNQLYEHNPEVSASLCRSYALSGDADKARQMLDKLFAISQQQYVSPYYIAYACLGIGDIEQSLFYLEKAYAEQDCELVLLKVDPRLDRLRTEPRFLRLMERSHARLI